ncbi:MAG TPA: PQQ-binding-like beta-propeller repeat protein [Pirellulales bacterium]|jgi:outer membrane protein assembly factor BamB|nr:PQQ-binding-like beta-propeller repeat protein [Pirellulales bacterium]
MSRFALPSIVVLGVLGAAGSAPAQRLGGGIISETLAQRHGLHRAWVAQVAVDPGKGRIEYVTLKWIKGLDGTPQGLLLVQTDQATLHVLDAETRRTLWVAQVGKVKRPTTPPTCDALHVVSTNGGILYLFDLRDGRLIWEKKLESIPSTGPVIGGVRVYVPLVTGIVASYRLPQPHDDELPAERVKKDQVLRYKSKGMADAPPIFTQDSVVWGTTNGDVYAATADEMVAKFRFRTRQPIIAPLSYFPPFIYAASRDGYVYGLRDEKGYKRWQFSAGNPVVEQPVVIDDALYAISETGDMFKLALDTGLEEWSLKGIERFVAASQTKLYVVDLVGRLQILDVATGARLGAMPMEYLSLKIVNTQSDRIYLGSPTGMIQCLHERELVDPIRHFIPEPVSEDDERGKKGGTKPARGDMQDRPDMPADDDNPFAAKPDAGDEMVDDEAMSDEE